MSNQLILRGTAGMNYSYPHAEMGIYIKGAVRQPTAQTADGARTAFVIYSPSGKTDTLVKFDGSTAYDDCVAMYGEKDMKRKGLVYDTLLDHLAADGKAIVYNPRTADAALANSTLLLTTTPVDDKRLWVDAEGKIYAAKPADTIVVKEFGLNTFKFEPIFQSLANMNTKEELELAVGSLKKMTNPAAGVIPMYSVSYIGRNRYGNNLDVYFKQTTKKIGSMKMFGMVVYNRDTEEPLGTYKATHGLGIYENGIPMNMGEVLQRFDKEKNVLVSSYEDVLEEEFNGLYIKMLDSLCTQIQDKITTDGLVELQALYTFLNDLKVMYEQDDSDTPAINLVDIFGQTLVNDFNAVFTFPEDGQEYTMRLANGSDGIFGQMKRFDFDFAIKEGTVTKYPLVEVYKDFFNGSLTGDIYSMESFNADYILDLDFPLEVKAAMGNFVARRPDVPVLFNYLSTLRTFEELKTQYTAFNCDAIQAVHFINSAINYNIDEKKNMRVPFVKLLNKTILSHFKAGFKDSIAGKFINDIVDLPDAVYPKVNTPEELQWLFDNNLNYITPTKYGWMIDGQAGNLKNQEHPAKQLFNLLLVGRILKDIMGELSVNRHFLNEAGTIAEFNTLINDKVISKYKTKINVTYKCYFADEYAEATGTLTDELTISGSDTVKRHDLKVYLDNKYSS